MEETIVYIVNSIILFGMMCFILPSLLDKLQPVRMERFKTEAYKEGVKDANKFSQKE